MSLRTVSPAVVSGPPILASRANTSGRTVLAALLLVALVRGILYAVLNPPFGSPDEQAHFQYVAYLAGGTIGGPGAEAHQPALYYVLMVPIYWLASNQPPAVQLLAIRLSSITFLLGTVMLTWLAARKMTPHSLFVPIVATAFVAFHPQFGYVGASANNDNGANFVAALLTYLAISLLLGSARRLTIFATVLTIAASVMTKGQILPLTIVSSVVVIGHVVHWMVTAKSKEPVIYLCLAALAVLVALGTRDGTALMNRTQAMLPVIEKWQESVETAKRMGFDPFLYQFATFWSAFLGEAVRPPLQSYIAPAAATAMALVGYVVQFNRPIRSGMPTTRREMLLRLLLLSMLVGVWALTYLTFLRVNNPSYQGIFWSLPTISGRYLFTAIVPIALLLAEGWSSLIREGHDVSVAAGLIALFAAFDILSIAMLVGYHGWPTYG